MKLSAFAVSSAFIVSAVLLLAPGAEAQTVFSHSNQRQLACFCGGEAGTGTPFCVEDAPCAGIMTCTSTADCGAGEICLDADNFCAQAVCVVVCDSLTCTDPGNTTDGFEICPEEAPTMGQWGLITLAALLLLGGALMLRFNGRTTRAAIVLVALSVLTAAWAYASIQANPKTCSSSEASVVVDIGR